MRFGFGRSGGSYNYTDRLRVALVAANKEAGELRHDAVAPEHMLLGLLHDRGSLAVALLRERGIDPDVLDGRVRARLHPGDRPANAGGVPLTGLAKGVLVQALSAARERSQGDVGTEHLLLGILAVPESVAAQVLGELGVTAEGARAALRALERAQARGFAVELDDASSASIYEQIVAQIREAVATGRLAPGERLATVRQLADELDIAPGTVARAYAELERLGVVRTEGARGTRVAQRPPSAAAPVDPATLVGLLRPVAVAAFHLGATAEQLRAALEESMRGILMEPPGPPA